MHYVQCVYILVGVYTQPACSRRPETTARSPTLALTLFNTRSLTEPGAKIVTNRCQEISVPLCHGALILDVSGDM